MGCQLSKADSDLLKSETALLKAHIYKKSCLDNDLNSLIIRQSYSKLNPCKRNFKKMFTIRKVIKNLMIKTSLVKNRLQRNSQKVHGYLQVLDSSLINEYKVESSQLVEELGKASQSEARKIECLKARLEDLRNLLLERKIMFEENKRKIEGIRAPKGVYGGKENSLELLSVLDGKELREKSGFRIDSVSTAVNESFEHLHVKNSFSVRTEDLGLEKIEVPILDLSVQVQGKPFNAYCPKKSIQLSQGALLLRIKLQLKNDVESFLSKNKKIMKHNLKQTKAIANKYESAGYALENDPQAYLAKLLKEIAVREYNLNAKACMKAYRKAQNSFGKNEEESSSELQDESISD